MTDQQFKEKYNLTDDQLNAVKQSLGITVQEPEKEDTNAPLYERKISADQVKKDIQAWAASKK